MRLVPTALAAMALGVKPGTVRFWASLGALTRHGTKQRALYDIDELTELSLARDRGEWKPPARVA